MLSRSAYGLIARLEAHLQKRHLRYDVP